MDSPPENPEETEKKLEEALGKETVEALSEELKPGDLAEDRQEDSLASVLTRDTLDGLPPEKLPPSPPLKQEKKQRPVAPKKTKPKKSPKKEVVDFSKQPTLIQDLSTDSPPIPTPKTIGPYKVEGLLDKGGMSLLYLATHPETHKAITIKVLLPKYVKNKEMKKRFLKEAHIISLTDHPNIVKLYGHGEWQHGLYIAMEFIRGVSLKQFILQNSMSLKKSLELILKVAYALAHFHTHSVIHRDLKPENILLTEKEGIKVIDFGIAQLNASTPSRITQQNRMMGTPYYMSPEQKETPLDISYNSDIYALGIIAYELLLGKLSHGVVHVNLMPKGFQKILKKMLHLDPKKRYQDIVEVIQDISSYLKSPTVEKDVKGKDIASQLSEELVQAQEKLLPPAIPKNWKGVSIGLCHHKTLNLSGLYYDFIELSEGKYGIILAESTAKAAKGIVYTAVLRGMVRSLAPKFENPLELIKQLNQLLCHDPLDQVFALSYLILDPSSQSLEFISCGFGNLWLHALGAKEAQLLHSENIGLGIDKDLDILQVSHGWRAGDTLLLNTFGILSEKDPHNRLLKKSLKESLVLQPQEQAQAIMNQLKSNSSSKKKLQQRPYTLISIQRS